MGLSRLAQSSGITQTLGWDGQPALLCKVAVARTGLELPFVKNPCVHILLLLPCLDTCVAAYFTTPVFVSVLLCFIPVSSLILVSLLVSAAARPLTMMGVHAVPTWPAAALAASAACAGGLAAAAKTGAASPAGAATEAARTKWAASMHRHLPAATCTPAATATG